MVDSAHENNNGSQKESGRTIPKIEINTEHTEASIVFSNLRLTKDKPVTEEVLVVIEKHPTSLEQGKSYNHKSVLIDSETPRMQWIAAKAEALKTIPEEKRVKEILELLRSEVKYAHRDTISELVKTNTVLAEWVAKNTGLNSPYGNEVPLSLVFENGYAICRHLSVAYLWLAQKAGMEGAILSGRVGKNIQRTDTGEKLFRSADVDKPVEDFHYWNEIRLSNGKWVPVDPSTNLSGNTSEGLEMFLAAKYSAEVAGNGFKMQVETKELAPVTTAEAVFAPGQKFTEGKYKLLLKSSKAVIQSGNLVPGSDIPYSGEGKVKFVTTAEDGVTNLTIANIGIAESFARKAKTIGLKLNEYRKAVPPEREFVLGVGIAGLYTVVLLRPDILPENITEILNFLRKLNLVTDWSIVGATAIGLGATIDGAGRIVNERVPLVKTYVSFLKQELADKLRKK